MSRFYQRRKDSTCARNSSGAHQPPAAPAATPTRHSYSPGMYLGDIAGSIERSDCSSDEDAGIHSCDFDFGFDTPSHSPETDHNPSVPTTSSSTPPSSTENSYMVGMLQQQQFMLKNVLDSQKRFEEKQKAFETKLQEIESKVNKPNTLTPPTPGSNKKRKKVVTRTLSVRKNSLLCMLL